LGVAIERGSLAEILQIADTAWLETNQPPANRTPFMLEKLAALTHGKTLVANLEVLCNNAAVASNIAIALAT
jgi:pseudouridine-5'-phosphate glycosidase